MKSQFINTQQTNSLSNIAGWSSNLASVLALAIAPFSGSLGIPMSFMALASAVGANACFRSSTRTERLIDDFDNIASQSNQNAVYREFETVNTPAITLEPKQESMSKMVSAVQVFEWKTIKTDPVNYPHIALLTKTGGGKSTLAQYLCTLCDGDTYALDPHYEAGSYSTADYIIGAGRNYGECTTDEPLVTVPTPETTIAQFFGWLEYEMNRRYQLDENGKRGTFKPINIVCDEFGSYANIKGIPQIFKTVLREGRKVGIRLIICIHGQQVKSLGLEGESDLRECISFVRLGVFALEYAEMQIRNSKNGTLTRWEKTLAKLESFERAALVDDIPALIPPLLIPENTGLHPSLKTFTTQARSPVATPVDSPVDSPVDEAWVNSTVRYVENVPIAAVANESHTSLIELAKRLGGRLTGSQPGNKLTKFRGVKSAEMREIFKAMAECGLGVYDPKSGAFTI